MRFFSLIAGAAIAAVAMAQSPVNITNTEFNPEAGKPFTITYTPATIPVTVLLKNGPSGNLKTVSEIGKSTSGSVTWNVPANLPKDQYAFEIVPATGEPNYSGQFAVQGASGSPSSSPASSLASNTGASSTPASTPASSSPTPSITRTTASISGSPSPSSGNSTISLPTLSTSASAASRSSGATGTGNLPPQNTGAASTLAQSPLALILGAAAAMVYLA